MKYCLIAALRCSFAVPQNRPKHTFRVTANSMQLKRTPPPSLFSFTAAPFPTIHHTLMLSEPRPRSSCPSPHLTRLPPPPPHLIFTPPHQLNSSGAAKPPLPRCRTASFRVAQNSVAICLQCTKSVCVWVCDEEALSYACKVPSQNPPCPRKKIISPLHFFRF